MPAVGCGRRDEDKALNPWFSSAARMADTDADPTTNGSPVVPAVTDALLTGMGARGGPIANCPHKTPDQADPACQLRAAPRARDHP
ncbi:hypothetical protein GCM10022267_31490 [Lentzea roselyniae]|uniref:Uncharacterized protein n=1 Tax=Lentzea roselyniae TaxID=531940 RepID=A0ABP7AY23_9PSEU